MSKLYDRADIYDLMESEYRYNAFMAHWNEVLKGKKVHMLDLGIKLSGSDLSEAMLARCSKKIKAKGYEADLHVCDFRNLADHFPIRFDCVASTGNSFPYVTNDELLSVLEQMDELIVPGGYLYFDIRNWDYVVKTKQRFYTYNPIFDGDTRINLVQCWDHNADGTIDFNLLYTFEKDNRVFQKEIFQEHYYPVSQKLLLDKLSSMGYREIALRRFPVQAGEYAEDCDWYCVIARKGN